MADLNQFAATITLSQLLEILSELGISVCLRPSVVDRPAPEPQGASNPANEAVMATVGYALSELGIDTHRGSSNSSGASAAVASFSSGVGEAAGTGACASGTVKGKEVAALEDSPPHYAAPSSVAHTRNTKAYLQWYVVIRGLKVGVFQGWHIVEPLVSGVSRGLQEKCPSEEAGWVIFNQALQDGTVEQLSR